jgi:SPP1 gp7 family putative phage head morphogenesis protein
VFQSAKGVSIIDQRLAAEMHKRQIETLVKAEGVANRVSDGIEEAASRWVQMMASDVDISIRLRVGSRLWYNHFMGIAPTLDDQFRRLIGWSHQEQVAVYAAVIPRRWFRKVSPEVAAIPNLEEIVQPPLPSRDVTVPGQLGAQDLRAAVSTEPIAERTERMSDEEWQRVLSEVVFQPPSRAEVEQMLHTKGPDGISWQGRFEQLSRRITDIDRMSQELIVGYANGENLQQLKKRALPLVEGIQASAKRIVRTEGLRIAEQVQRRSWDGLGDMMVGAQVLAVLDQNTRPEHAARNGTIYYEQPTAGQKSMAELPMLPDQPNCRCWSTPVLQPPKELENDPDVAAAFANDQGAGIPDPASYDNWFASADRERQVMAVGARRYRAVEDLLRGLRPPEWTDFIDEEGKLLPISKINSESPADRATRKFEVGEVIRKRGEQVKAIAAKGFVLPGDVGPAGVTPILPPAVPPLPVLPPVVPPPPPITPVLPPVILPPVTVPTAPVIAPSQPPAQVQTIPPKLPRPQGKPPLAKTLKDAERIAKEYDLADFVDFTGLDVVVANDMIAGISDALEDFPELRKNLKFIGAAQARNSRYVAIKTEEIVTRFRQVYGADPSEIELKVIKQRAKNAAGKVPGDCYAQSTDDKTVGGISFNSKLGKSAKGIKELLGRDVQSGFHPPGCDTVKSVVDHEMAHEIDKLLGLTKGRAISDPALRAIIAQYTPEQVVDGLSRYAKTNASEVIAEAWAEYKNNPQPREIATKIGQYIQSKRTAQ